MEKKLIGALFLSLLIASPVFALTGREIMEKSDALPQPDSGITKVLMVIQKGKRMDEKEFIARVKKYTDDEDKAIIAFSKPTKIKLLTHAHKGKENDQWLRLSSGRVKRIAAADKGKPFVNSHFYYEDLGGIDIDEYDYTVLDDADALGEACYRVEAKKNTGDKVYDKIVLYVRKSDFFVLKIDFYRKGELHKYMENHNVKTISGILTPLRVVMARADGKGKTELQVKGVKYNVALKDASFNKEALR